MVADSVRSAIQREFVSRFIPVTLVGEQPEWAAKEIERHVDGRFNEFQQEHIPWLEVGGTLAGCEVLEIGCGTGSSTAALCLAGAKVHAIDMDAKSVEFAALRCELMELNTADFAVMNATEIASIGRAFDRVLFYAAFEHMTHVERKRALGAAWQMVKPGGIVAIVEAPNRLWHFDEHTTLTPFFHWLPDELAIDYLSIAESHVQHVFAKPELRDRETLARLGRGVSYHDLEVAIGRVAALEVLPGLMDHRRTRDPKLDVWWAEAPDPDPTYHRLLRGFVPALPSAFFYPWFDVMVRRE